MHYEKLSFGRVAPFDKQSGVWHTHLSSLVTLRESPTFSDTPLPRFATILLLPDSKGHKPKCNDNNSCGVAQQRK